LLDDARREALQTQANVPFTRVASMNVPPGISSRPWSDRRGRFRRIRYYWDVIRQSLGLLLIATLAIYGQAPDRPVLRSTTRLVQIGVVVHKGDGPATGLTKDDFQIFDNGKEQRVATFSGGEPSVISNGSTGSNGPTGAATPRVFSNRAERGAKGLTVVLLDALNTVPGEQQNAKTQVVRCLSQLENNNSLALYALGNRLLVLHDFTNDTAHLRQLLEQYRSGALPTIDLNPARSGLTPSPATAGTPLDRMAADANLEVSAYNSRFRTQLTISALQAIAKHLKDIPGRKNLVWISSGFPVNIATVSPTAAPYNESFQAETKNLARALTDADIAVYTVQTGGLTNISALNANVGRTSRRPQAGTNPLPMAPASMTTLADWTGGKAYYNTNDLGNALQHALSDAEATYSLGFYPAEETLDGKFHEIRVKVKARANDVRYRRGYFATPDAIPTPEQRQTLLNEAVASPLEATGVAMKVRVDPADQPKPGSLRLVVGVELNTLTLAPKGDHRVGVVQMMMVQQASNGRRVGGTDETIRLDLTPEEFTRMTNDGLVLVKYLKPEPDAFQIRVFMLDTNSGALGSVYVPTSVQN
jgi:VWFA-related protein